MAEHNDVECPTTDAYTMNALLIYGSEFIGTVENFSRLQKEIYGSTYSDIVRRCQTLVNSTLEGLREPK